MVVVDVGLSFLFKIINPNLCIRLHFVSKMNNTNFVSVNDLFKENIFTITAADIQPCGIYCDKESRLKILTLEEIINSIGQMSTKAQGLKRVLTTTEKLRLSPNHKLYILKDEKGKGGNGEVIGILKIGVKQLFLHNELGKSVIATPMCVLDFYVVESRQRNGFGKKLFDYMLEDQKLNAYELAIDGPSSKMLQFLKKHYNITKIVKHSNNFAVCDKFFKSSNTGPQGECQPSPHPALHRRENKSVAGLHGGSSSGGTLSQIRSAKVEQNRRPVFKKWSSEAGAHLKAAHVIALKRVKKEEDVLVVTRNYAHFYHLVKLSKNPKRFRLISLSGKNLIVYPVSMKNTI